MKETRRVAKTLKPVKVHPSLTCSGKNKLLLLALCNWDRGEKSIWQIDNCIVILICSIKSTTSDIAAAVGVITYLCSLKIILQDPSSFCIGQGGTLHSDGTTVVRLCSSFRNNGIGAAATVEG